MGVRIPELKRSPLGQASVGFLMRYYGELREPLMWHLGSQVSMRMARGSASLLSPLRPLRGLQESRVATREESGAFLWDWNEN